MLKEFAQVILIFFWPDKVFQRQIISKEKKEFYILANRKKEFFEIEKNVFLIYRQSFESD